jgi:hypothetical protein
MHQPLAEVVNGLIGVLGLRRINTDETHTFTIVHNHRIAVDYTLHNTVITVDGEQRGRHCYSRAG